ncbi:hypothetical protein NO263_06650 [Gluconacetobacter entanii]|uniref:Uncharacterized protein n=1 Tax=Gluconacetobacter entanii TaxID=108528 RepID=A0ABT3K4Z1_9PROT|nr:hypothetical protein [Gluconacetobacter entanii]MCW4590256.1 hypothetical protein [Gluconacetobacter entanii]MCW4594271.1 hypothetical protein [Gluconacetobacter entanii]
MKRLNQGQIKTTQIIVAMNDGSDEHLKIASVNWHSEQDRNLEIKVPVIFTKYKLIGITCKNREKIDGFISLRPRLTSEFIRCF